MNKEEPNEILTKIGKHEAKIILGNPADKKKADKLNAMRIALTYIEGQEKTDVTPEEATKIADKFLAWLEKK